MLIMLTTRTIEHSAAGIHNQGKQKPIKNVKSKSINPLVNEASPCLGDKLRVKNNE